MINLPKPDNLRPVKDVGDDCRELSRLGWNDRRWSVEKEFEPCSTVYEGKIGRYRTLHHLHAKKPNDLKRFKCCVCGVELFSFNESDWSALKDEGLI